MCIRIAWQLLRLKLITDEVYIADISPVNSAAVLVLLVQVLQIRLHILFLRVMFSVIIIGCIVVMKESDRQQ